MTQMLIQSYQISRDMIVLFSGSGQNSLYDITIEDT